jgi:hypothetical protein
MDCPTRIIQCHAHRARALLCEQREHAAPDAASRKEWIELAIEWHWLARTVQATKTSALLSRREGPVPRTASSE